MAKVRWVLVIAGAIAVIGFAIVFTALLPWLANRVPALADAGNAKVGDAFGAVGALFAGLGSFGVAVVLAYDLLHRKEEFRPYVLPGLTKIGVTRASWKGSTQLTVNLMAELRLESVTDAPALNLKVAASVRCGGAVVHAQTGPSLMPLANEPIDHEISFSAEGESAQKIIKALSEDSARLELVITYESLNGVVWRSVVSHEVSARSADQNELRSTAKKDSGVEIEPSSNESFGGETLVLDAPHVLGSWRQERA